jgi:hypothetical protein
MHPMPASPVPALLLSMSALGGCSPALDWRELRPEAGGVVFMLPCKPTVQARKLMLAGSELLLTLHACQAAEITWAMAFADVADPARVGPALQALRDSAAANIGAREPKPLPLTVPGATPQANAGRLEMSGRRADGQPVLEQVAVFAKGTRVYQATAIGPALPAEALEVFFDGLKTP